MYWKNGKIKKDNEFEYIQLKINEHICRNRLHQEPVCSWFSNPALQGCTRVRKIQTETVTYLENGEGFLHVTPAEQPHLVMRSVIMKLHRIRIGADSLQCRNKTKLLRIDKYIFYLIYIQSFIFEVERSMSSLKTVYWRCSFMCNPFLVSHIWIQQWQAQLLYHTGIIAFSLYLA